MNETKQLVAAAADSLRTFTHQTRIAQLPDGCMTAPDAYSILGSAAPSSPRCRRPSPNSVKR